MFLSKEQINQYLIVNYSLIFYVLKRLIIMSMLAVFLLRKPEKYGSSVDLKYPYCT